MMVKGALTRVVPQSMWSVPPALVSSIEKPKSRQWRMSVITSSTSFPYTLCPLGRRACGGMIPTSS